MSEEKNLQVDFKEEIEKWFVIFIYKLTSVKLWIAGFTCVFVVLVFPFCFFVIYPQTHDLLLIRDILFKCLELWALVAGFFFGVNGVTIVANKVGEVMGVPTVGKGDSVVKDPESVVNGNGDAK